MEMKKAREQLGDERGPWPKQKSRSLKLESQVVKKVMRAVLKPEER